METAIYMLYYAATVKLLFCKGFINESIFYDQNQLTVCHHDF